MPSLGLLEERLILAHESAPENMKSIKIQFGKISHATLPQISNFLGGTNFDHCIYFEISLHDQINHRQFSIRNAKGGQNYKIGDLIPICLLLHLEAGINSETFFASTFSYKPSPSTEKAKNWCFRFVR